MAVLVIVAIYGGYFAVRWPLWSALYRRRGHLEHEGLLKEARNRVWVVAFLAFVLPLGLVLGRGYPVPLWPLLGSSVVVGAMVIAFGRLPVDVPILTLISITVYHTWLAAYAGESFRNSPGIWLAFVIGLAVWGLIEHYTWLRSGEGDASREGNKGDAA
jgi:hypothetical protein